MKRYHASQTVPLYELGLSLLQNTNVVFIKRRFMHIMSSTYPNFPNPNFSNNSHCYCLQSNTQYMLYVHIHTHTPGGDQILLVNSAHSPF